MAVELVRATATLANIFVLYPGVNNDLSSDEINVSCNHPDENLKQMSKGHNLPVVLRRLAVW
jgi:hypothetical protein